MVSFGSSYDYMHGYGVEEEKGYGGGAGAYSFQHDRNSCNGRGRGLSGQFGARGSGSLGFGGGLGGGGRGFGYDDAEGAPSGFRGRGGGGRGKSFGHQADFYGNRGGKGFVVGSNYGGNEDYGESGNDFDDYYVQGKSFGFGGAGGYGLGGGGLASKNVKGPRGGLTGANNVNVGGGRGNIGFGFGQKRGQRGGGGAGGGRGGGGGLGQNQGRGRGRNNLSSVKGTQQSQAKKRPLSVSPSRWATLYDAPLPSTLTSMCTLAKCGLCDIPFNGPATSKSHYDGKAHEKKVIQYLASNVTEEQSRPKKVKMSTISTPTVVEGSSDLSCSLCNLVCTSTVVYDSHMQGKNHAIKVRAASSARSGELGCGVCNINVTSQDALTTHLMGKQHKRKSERMKDIQEGVQLHCVLCGVKSTDRPGLEAHLKGKRHLEKLEGKKKTNDEKVEGNDTNTKKDVKKEMGGTGETKKLASVKVIDYNTYDFKSFGGDTESKVEDVIN